jgi:hypothetical protein
MLFPKSSNRLPLLVAVVMALFGAWLATSMPAQANGNGAASPGAVTFALPNAATGPIGQAVETDQTGWQPCYPCPRGPIYPPYPIIIVCPGCPIPYPSACDFPYFPPDLPVPGATPRPTPTLVPVPTPTPGGSATAAKYQVCPQLASVIPADVQALALAEPWRIYGFNMHQNPNIPEHPLWNPLRTRLSLRDWTRPYSRCNTVVWKSSCP